MQKVERFLFYCFILFLPTQLGKHFWPDFSFVSGIRIDYLSPIIYFTDVLFVLLFAVFLLRKRRSFTILNFKTQIVKLKRKSKMYFFVCFALLFLVCNTFFSNNPLLSFYGLLKLCECSFLVIYLVKTIHKRVHLQWISFLFAVSALFESTLAIAQYVNQGSLNSFFYYFGERTFTGTTPGIANADIGGTLVLRPYATFPHPNVLAGYLLVSIILVWSFVLKSNQRWVQLFGVVSLIISSIALLLTFGRVAILLWLFLVLFIVGRNIFKMAKTFRIRVFFVFLLAMGLIILSTSPLVHEISLRFLQTSLSDESVTERTELLSASLKMMQAHPFIGVGLDNFIPALAPLQKPMPLGLYLQPVHNIFVLVLAETGIVGFVLFIWFLVVTVKRIMSQESGIRNMLSCLLLIIFFTGSFDHYWLTLQQGQLLFAMILGLSWARLQQS